MFVARPPCFLSWISIPHFKSEKNAIHQNSEFQVQSSKWCTIFLSFHFMHFISLIEFLVSENCAVFLRLASEAERRTPRKRTSHKAQVASRTAQVASSPRQKPEASHSSNGDGGLGQRRGQDPVDARRERNEAAGGRRCLLRRSARKAKRREGGGGGGEIRLLL